MWDRIARAGRASWSLLGIGVVLAVLMILSWQIRVIFPPLVLAGAIVFILNPVVDRLQARGVPRAGGAAICYVGFFALLGSVGVLIWPMASDQVDQLATDWPEIRQNFEDWVDDLSVRSEEGNWPIQVPTLDEIVDSLGGGGADDVVVTDFNATVEEARTILEGSGDAESALVADDLGRLSAEVVARVPSEGGLDIGESFNALREVGTRVFEVALIFLLGPIIAFYLLVDLPHVQRVLMGLIPESARAEVVQVGHRLNHAIGGYFRGQLAVALIVGTMVSIGLAILGLDLWLIVGMIAGVFNMVPLIGPYVGAVPGLAIAFTTGGGLSTAIWVALIMTVAQQIDNHFISPLVMQRTTSLHPAAVMLALLVGGTLGGFFGLLLAVPIAASLKVILGHMWRVYILGQPLEQVEAIQAGDDSEPQVGIVERIGRARAARADAKAAEEARASAGSTESSESAGD